jgi:hypothetical protein
MRNSRESSNGHNTSLGEATSPDPKEQNEVSFADVVGPVMRLDDLLKYFAKSGREVDQEDLIVLTTADGTLVCPEQQLTERTDEAGNRTWEVSPYAIALWKVTGLSGHNGWTRAAGLADLKYEISGYQYSLFDIATNPEISDGDKQSALRYVLSEEDKRAFWNGDPDFNKKREEVVAYIKNVLGVSVEE